MKQIDILNHLHNTQRAEYIKRQARLEEQAERIERLFQRQLKMQMVGLGVMLAILIIGLVIWH